MEIASFYIENFPKDGKPGQLETLVEKDGTGNAKTGKIVLNLFKKKGNVLTLFAFSGQKGGKDFKPAIPLTTHPKITWENITDKDTFLSDVEISKENYNRDDPKNKTDVIKILAELVNKGSYEYIILKPFLVKKDGYQYLTFDFFYSNNLNDTLILATSLKFGANPSPPYGGY